MRDQPSFYLRGHDSVMLREDGEADFLKTCLGKRCPDLKPESRQRIVRIVGYGLDALGVDQLNLAISDIDAFERRLSNTPFEAHGYKSYLRRSLMNAGRYLYCMAHEGDGADVAALFDRNRGAPAANNDDEPFQLFPNDNAGRGPGKRSARGASTRKAAPNGAKATKTTKSTKATHRGRAAVAGRAQPLPAQPTLADLDAVLDQLINLQLKLDSLDRRRIRELIERVLAVLDDASLVRMVGEVPGGYRRTLARAAPRRAHSNLRAVAQQLLLEALEERHAHRLTA